MDDTISRQGAIDFVGSMEMCDEISAEAYKKLTNYLDEMPSAETKKGKWEERAVENVNAAGIEEVQSARCSACGLYHTTPYMYYFSDYNFCPHCGARMVNEDE